MPRTSFIALAVLILTFTGAAAFGQTSPGADEARPLREENAKLRAENARLKQELEALRASRADATAAATDAAPNGSPIVVVQRGQSADVSLTPQITVTKPVPLERQYDPNLNQTTVWTRFEPLTASGALRNKVWMRMQAVYEGEHPAGKPRSITMVIDTHDTRALFKGLSKLPIELDDQTFECPVLNYSVDQTTVRRARTRIRLDEEHVEASVSEDLLQRLLQSESAALVVGLTRLELTMEQVMQFAAVSALGGAQ